MTLSSTSRDTSEASGYQPVATQDEDEEQSLQPPLTSPPLHAEVDEAQPDAAVDSFRHRFSVCTLLLAAVTAVVLLSTGAHNSPLPYSLTSTQLHPRGSPHCR